MDVGLDNGCCWSGRELKAQAVSPYLSGIPDCDGVTLPVRAIGIVVTPLIKHQCLSSAAPMPLHN